MQLIIPAFNEERRLPETLRALRAYVLAASEGAGAVDVHRRRQRQHRRDRRGGARLRLGRRCRCAWCTASAEARVPPSVRASPPRRPNGSRSWTPTAPPTSTPSSTRCRCSTSGADLAIGSRALDASITNERHSRVRAVGASAYRALTRRVAPGHQRHPVRVQDDARRPRPRGVRRDPVRRLLLRRRGDRPLPATRRPGGGVPRGLGRRPGLDLRAGSARARRPSPSCAAIGWRLRSRRAGRRHRTWSG